VIDKAKLDIQVEGVCKVVQESTLTLIKAKLYSREWNFFIYLSNVV